MFVITITLHVVMLALTTSVLFQDQLDVGKTVSTESIYNDCVARESLRKWVLRPRYHSAVHTQADVLPEMSKITNFSDLEIKIRSLQKRWFKIKIRSLQKRWFRNQNQSLQKRWFKIKINRYKWGDLKSKSIATKEVILNQNQSLQKRWF